MCLIDELEDMLPGDRPVKPLRLETAKRLSDARKHGTQKGGRWRTASKAKPKEDKK